jgi:hypothetical protein
MHMKEDWPCLSCQGTLAQTGARTTRSMRFRVVECPSCQGLYHPACWQKSNQCGKCGPATDCWPLLREADLGLPAGTFDKTQVLSHVGHVTTRILAPFVAVGIVLLFMSLGAICETDPVMFLSDDMRLATYQTKRMHGGGWSSMMGGGQNWYRFESWSPVELRCKGEPGDADAARHEILHLLATRPRIRNWLHPEDLRMLENPKELKCLEAATPGAFPHQQVLLWHPQQQVYFFHETSPGS